MLAPLLIAAALAASPNPDCRPEARISPHGDHLAAAFTLCAPATRFAFQNYNAPQRQGDWMPEGEGWTFDGAVLARADGAPFRTFTLDIAADRQFYDRRYVAIDRVGATGWTLLLSAFRPDGDELNMSFAGFGTGAVLRLDGKTQTLRGLTIDTASDGDRLAYVGPASNIADGPMTIVAGADVPEWLRARLIRDVGAAVARMTERFGRPPQSPPSLFITYRHTDEGTSFKGGVLDNGVVEVRLRGAALDESDTEFADRITNLAAHEAAHFWNGGVWRNIENERQPWLDEGGAEYLAARLWRSPDSFRAETERRLDNCLLRDASKPLNGSAGPVHGDAPYDCGYVIMLAADLAMQRAHRGDIFDLWRATFDATMDGIYSPESFMRIADERAGPAFAQFASDWLTRNGPPSNDELINALARFGVSARARTPTAREGFVINGRALMPVLGAICHGTHGFTTMRDRLVLDTGDRCGPELAGDPAIAGVNGASFITDPGAAHAAVRNACAAHADLIFETPEGARLAPVHCELEIAPLPTVYEIQALPELARP